MKASQTCLVLAFCFLNISAHTAPFDKDANGFKEEFTYLSQKRWFISNGWVNGEHQSCEWRANAAKIADGTLQLTLSDRGGKVRPVGCPELRTNEALGYGRYETRLRTAASRGVTTTFFTFIGPHFHVAEHDEIDFEFLGKDPSTVQINYFTNGAGHHEKIIPLGFDSSKEFHTYAFEWTKEKIVWFADDKKLFETPEGANIPKNPGFLFLSLWSGSPMLDAWLGAFRYTSPLVAEVEWVKFTPFSKKNGVKAIIK